MRFELLVPVTKVDGYQIWAVEAEDMDAAICRLRTDVRNGEFVREEIVGTKVDFGNIEAG